MAERLLSVGMIGDDIAALHETLLQHGLKIPESETGRGFFGPATRNAVLAIQDRNRLAATGHVDTTTAAALLVKPSATASPGDGAVKSNDERSLLGGGAASREARMRAVPRPAPSTAAMQEVMTATSLTGLCALLAARQSS